MTNDVLTGTLFPSPLPNESFILRRDGVSVEVKTPSYGKLFGSGEIFLSNIRIVFHATGKKSKPDFLSYQLDLANILRPKFEQPLFGANYLTGTTRSITPDNWTIRFNKGGCGTLLPVLTDLLQRIGPAPPALVPGGSRPSLIATTSVAYIDPNDPSFIYVQQPIPPRRPLE